MNKIASIFLLSITFTISTFALSNPHPFLVNAAKQGHWNDFKDFLQTHPDEQENLDDTVFSLITQANRWDVLDGQPRPSAPPPEDAPKSNFRPEASAPDLDLCQLLEQEDAKLAREFQEEEYALVDANPQFVEPLALVQPETNERANRKICNLKNVLTGAVTAFAVFMIWNDASL